MHGKPKYLAHHYFARKFYSSDISGNLKPKAPCESIHNQWCLQLYDLHLSAFQALQKLSSQISSCVQCKRSVKLIADNLQSSKQLMNTHL